MKLLKPTSKYNIWEIFALRTAAQVKFCFLVSSPCDNGPWIQWNLFMPCLCPHSCEGYIYERCWRNKTVLINVIVVLIENIIIAVEHIITFVASSLHPHFSTYPILELPDQPFMCFENNSKNIWLIWWKKIFGTNMDGWWIKIS